MYARAGSCVCQYERPPWRKRFSRYKVDSSRAYVKMETDTLISAHKKFLRSAEFFYKVHISRHEEIRSGKGRLQSPTVARTFR